MNKFSIVIITFNEEKIIEKCITACQKVSNDIVVIDSFSTDKTEEICKQLGVHFIQQKWLGYSQQKNFGNTKTKNDWILSIDADEILTEDFIKEIQALQFSNAKNIYKICRLNNYCQQWIKHGRWYPEWRNRLFNKQFVEWNGDIVHENLSAKKGGFLNDFSFIKINGNVFHYSMQSKKEHLEKAEKYATLSAQKMNAKNQKATFIKRFLSPASRFLVDFFLKFGFLDGKLGYQIAKISAFETYLKYSKLYALNKLNS